jgi:hypothetical protein
MISCILYINCIQMIYCLKSSPPLITTFLYFKLLKDLKGDFFLNSRIVSCQDSPQTEGFSVHFGSSYTILIFDSLYSHFLSDFPRYYNYKPFFAE